MKLKNYIKKLNEIAEKHPNINVIYSIDEEGNGYDNVISNPSLGFFHEEYKEFHPEEIWDEDDGEFKINAICIN